MEKPVEKFAGFFYFYILTFDELFICKTTL